MDELQEALEMLVDKHGIGTVTQQLSEICGLKAEHLLSNWGERTAAREWQKAGKRLEKAGDYITEILGR